MNQNGTVVNQNGSVMNQNGTVVNQNGSVVNQSWTNSNHLEEVSQHSVIQHTLTRLTKGTNRVKSIPTFSVVKSQIANTFKFSLAKKVGIVH